MEPKIIITPKTRVRELLDNYPGLEELLVKMAPAFKKLKNPVLRNTIARVTTLQQAALVGNMSVDELVNALRKAAGQGEMSFSQQESGKSVRPDWFDENRIVGSLDARKMLEAGKEPLGDVLRETAKLEHGQVFMFSAPFYPAPLIEKLRSSGFECWTDDREKDLFLNYAYRP